MTGRKFTDKPAEARDMGYAFGVTGYAGSGKTLSALYLAAGAARAMGTEVWCIDTDNRAQEYAKEVPFRHVAMDAPYSPADYLDAAQYCASKGARVIVIDSMSDEHDGEGGILEMHARSGGKGLSSWQPVKDERNRWERWVRQQWKAGVVFGFSYRAKLKYKPKTPDEKVREAKEGTPKDPTDHQWDVTSTSDLPYMCSVRFLLPPGSDGKPLLKPTTAQEKVFVKTTLTFAKYLNGLDRITEQAGFDLYNLAKGSARPSSATREYTISKGDKSVNRMLREAEAEKYRKDGYTVVLSEAERAEAALNAEDAAE